MLSSDSDLCSWQWGVYPSKATWQEYSFVFNSCRHGFQCVANIDSAVSKSGHLEQGLTDPFGSAFVTFPCWASIGPLLMWFSREINIFYLFFMYHPIFLLLFSVQ